MARNQLHVPALRRAKLYDLPVTTRAARNGKAPERELQATRTMKGENTGHHEKLLITLASCDLAHLIIPTRPRTLIAFN